MTNDPLAAAEPELPDDDGMPLVGYVLAGFLAVMSLSWIFGIFRHQ